MSSQASFPVQHGRGYTLRPGTPADLDVLARIFQRYQVEIQPFTGDTETLPLRACRRQLRAAMARSCGAVLVVDCGQVLGFCIVRIVWRQAHRTGGWFQGLAARVCFHLLAWIPWAARGRPVSGSMTAIAYLDDVYVAPEGRRQGLALPLFRYAFSWARAQGVTVMEGATWADNHTMLRLAKHLDIQEVRVLLRKQL